MTLTMATQDQIDLIRKLAIDQEVPPFDVGRYFQRTTDLNDKGALIVTEIAYNLAKGEDVQPDGTDLGQYIEN